MALVTSSEVSSAAVSTASLGAPLRVERTIRRAYAAPSARMVNLLPMDMQLSIHLGSRRSTREMGRRRRGIGETPSSPGHAGAVYLPARVDDTSRREEVLLDRRRAYALPSTPLVLP